VRVPYTRHAGQVVRGEPGRQHALASRLRARAAAVAAVAVLGSLAVPGGAAGAAAISGFSGSSGHQSLRALVAEATRLSNEIDALSQQYDGLKIQFTEARAEIRIARQTARQDEQAVALGRSAIGEIAAEGYMTGGFSPTLQLLQSSNPQGLLNRASIITQLQEENGDQIDGLESAAKAAQRAQLTAEQESRQAVKLQKEMRAKEAAAQAKENILNSAAYARAMAQFRRTGHYPNIDPPGDSLGVQALRWALTRIGDPYVWGGAGPNDFDCSGLVMWAYAQVGIHLDHYTGDQWNEGEHISRSQLQPGDLVFFFPDISHVGLYVGNGLMVDAPTFGQPVQIQPIFWSAYVGAVRIVA